MTITELYERLSDKEFLNPDTGNLFSKAYMYLYDPKEEYHVRNEMKLIKDRLIRPDIYRNILILDIFQAFLDFLNHSTFGKRKKFDFLIEQEEKNARKVEDSLHRDATSPKFFAFLNDKIGKHFNDAGDYEVGYVFVHGFGSIFPYLRASKFLNNFEKYFMDNSQYKLILFYPGSADQMRIKLFSQLEDENPYRAIKLINQ
jgi:hypothetical protein